MEEGEIIKHNLQYIQEMTDNSEIKKNDIISDLDWLLLKENNLKNLISKIDIFDSLKKNHIIEFAILDSFRNYLDESFLTPYYNDKAEYKQEYYNFLFRFHNKISSPNLIDKKMHFFNYQIKLGHKYLRRNYIDRDVNSDDVYKSDSVDTEFYQILILQYWLSFCEPKIQHIDFNFIKNRIFSNYDDFSHSDIVVTKTSKGKSRVENSFDIIKRTFKKIGIIDKDETLTYFGLFIVKLMQLEHSNIRPTSEYRGIKSINQLLAKPINDLIFHFDLNDFEKLNLQVSKQRIDDLKVQIELYKNNPKNIAILNLPNYSRPH